MIFPLSINNWSKIIDSINVDLFLNYVDSRKIDYSQINWLNFNDWSINWHSELSISASSDYIIDDLIIKWLII